MNKKQMKQDKKLQSKIQNRYMKDVEYYTFLKVILGYIIFSSMVCVGYLAHTYFIRKANMSFLKESLIDCGFVWLISTSLFSVIAIIIQSIYLKFLRKDKNAEQKVFKKYASEQLNLLCEEGKITSSDKLRYYLRESLNARNIELEDLEVLANQDTTFNVKKKI